MSQEAIGQLPIKLRSNLQFEEYMARLRRDPLVDSWVYDFVDNYPEKKKGDKASVIGAVLEEHARRLLRGSSAVILNPIPDRAESEKYRFRLKEDNLQAVDLSAPELTFCEYDILALIGNLPTVVEVKSSISKTTDGKRDRYSIRGALSLVKVAANLLPIADYFRDRSEVGYAVVGIGDVDLSNSHLRSQYERAGGLYARLPFCKNELEKVVDHALGAKSQ